MPGVIEGHRDEWRSTLQSAGCSLAYDQKHEEISASKVVHFLVFDEDNPSSIRAAINTARNNGRAVRTALTTDVWESINTTWNDLNQMKSSSLRADQLPIFLGWIKQRVMSFRGALLGTMLRNDNYYFSQLGNFVERADSTARILDVKYFILLPKPTDVGSDLDMQQWAQILRSVSAHRAYRWFYRGSSYRPWQIAEFLILKAEMPRSLVFSYNWINIALDGLANLYGKRYECHDMAVDIRDRMLQGGMDQIFQAGLHEFLQGFVADNNALTASIAKTYNFP